MCVPKTVARMQTLKLEHLVEKSREGQYYTVPFEVPDGVEALTVQYRYPYGKKNANADPEGEIDFDYNAED